MTERKKYDSTVARIAGNLLSGVLSEPDYHGIVLHGHDPRVIQGAVLVARAIVAEVERTEFTGGELLNSWQPCVTCGGPHDTANHSQVTAALAVSAGPQSSPARLTPSEEGKATGSAIQTHSSLVTEIPS